MRRSKDNRKTTLTVIARGLAVGCSLLLSLRGSVANAQMSVVLDTSQPRYVLGEPVVLLVTVRNQGPTVVQHWKIYAERPERDMPVYIAGQEGPFRQYRMGIYGIPDEIRKPETWAPGQVRRYTLRILYAYEHPSRLAFAEPGSYRVKVRYPLVTRDDAKKTIDKTEFESNPVTVTIEQPQGVDARLWKIVQSPGFVYFLQSGMVRKGDADIAPQAADLLESVPKSSYHSGLRFALGEYYQRRRLFMTRDQVMQDPQMQRLRSLLGIVQPPEGPFPEDARLNVLVTYHFPELTRLEEVFKQISAQSGVTLHVGPGLRDRRTMSAKIKERLRTFMGSGIAYKAKWVREGKGYRLVPAPEPEEKPSGDAKSGDEQRP